MSCDVSRYGETPSATKKQVREQIERSYTWHKSSILENKPLEDSTYFPFDTVCKFVDEVATTYKEWRGDKC